MLGENDSPRLENSDALSFFYDQEKRIIHSVGEGEPLSSCTSSFPGSLKSGTNPYPLTVSKSPSGASRLLALRTDMCVALIAPSVQKKRRSSQKRELNKTGKLSFDMEMCLDENDDQLTIRSHTECVPFKRHIHKKIAIHLLIEKREETQKGRRNASDCSFIIC